MNFHGWEMPVHYTSLVEEHLCVREKAGLFDLSHMGELRLSGDTALATLDRLISNDPSKLEPGQVLYSPLMNERGGIVDDLVIYREGDGFFAVVNAANVEKDERWIRDHLLPGTTLENISADTALLAIQGPEAETIVNTAFACDHGSLGNFRYWDYVWNGIRVRISRTGYTGEDGFEIYVSAGAVQTVWNMLLKEGQPHGMQPIGLGARDTLRLEARLPLYGQDIDESTTPLEAGLSFAVAWDTEFLGKAVLTKQREEGLGRRLAGFILQERGIARSGCTILDGQGSPIGTVTSGSMSPSLQKGIGLGYIQRPWNKAGTEVYVQVRNRQLKALTHKGRFVQGKK